MRRATMVAASLMIAALIGLGGCASLFEGEWEKQARAQCDREPPASRGACHDRVDRETRDARRVF